MTETQIYWLITLPKLANGIGIFLTVFGVGVAFLIFAFFAVSNDGYHEPIKWESLKKYFNWSIFSAILGALMLTFIPSAKELVAIYAIPKVVNNEQVQAIPEKLLELANLKLDDLIQETK